MGEAKVEAKPAAKAGVGWIVALVLCAILFILVIPVALYVKGMAAYWTIGLMSAIFALLMVYIKVTRLWEEGE
ncbi:MAG: hypothetical protein N3H31_04085 [Candidatus Nezhaarchaeota archaeon]|nr:hypothetical protein [Candidatus Nezhaarchaeota archaeon]